MKFVTSQLLYFFQSNTAKRNVKVLCKFLAVLVLLIIAYSAVFHHLMALEGREYSWPTSIYWTLTVMTTLGFGDITFTSDIGRIFSVVVLLSGVIFLLVMLPFTFIQFFYAPWLEAQDKARTPRELPKDMHGHVILAGFEAVGMALIKKLAQYNYPYAILLNDQQQALELYDQGYKVVLGDIDDRQTYERLRAGQAALVVFNQDDQLNTNGIYTLRDFSSSTPIVANAESQASIDIMELAGANQVYHFSHMLGRSLARRVLGVSMHANIIGRFGQLAIAEAPAMRTPLEGKSLRESGIRESTGVNVVGIWQRGAFIIPRPETRISEHSVLVLAGSEPQLQRYDELYSVYSVSMHPVLILGGGRVGKAASQALAENQIDYRIVEKNVRLTRGSDRHIQGEAADLEVLKKAGIDSAPSVIITTNNDNMNIYLTIYCRRLRPDIQIITRTTLDRNISKLHQAGADLVMSYASMGANAVINFLKEDKELMLAEGLNIFRQQIPDLLAGKSLLQSKIREKSSCSVIAVRSGEDMQINPDPGYVLHKGEEIIMVGTTEAEKSFHCHFPQKEG
ncbi:potassium channel family protein [Desulfovermiculus halophilus]|uniref:potassium channel family protein n=1 Tax=Desulfovermiculus halophilus TaxID=339722 RepID=UPI00048407DC|nr:NAD-binding protein [Desulfovermiculus halophilus]